MVAVINFPIFLKYKFMSSFRPVPSYYKVFLLLVYRTQILAKNDQLHGKARLAVRHERLWELDGFIPWFVPEARSFRKLGSSDSTQSSAWASYCRRISIYYEFTQNIGDKINQNKKYRIIRMALYGDLEVILVRFYIVWSIKR